MTEAMTQVGIIAGVTALLFYMATRPPQNRRAGKASGDSAGAGDTGYAVGDSGHHHSGSGGDSASGHPGGFGDSSGGDRRLRRGRWQWRRRSRW